MPSSVVVLPVTLAPMLGATEPLREEQGSAWEPRKDGRRLLVRPQHGGIEGPDQGRVASRLACAAARWQVSVRRFEDLPVEGWKDTADQASPLPTPSRGSRPLSSSTA